VKISYQARADADVSEDSARSVGNARRAQPILRAPRRICYIDGATLFRKCARGRRPLLPHRRTGCIVRGEREIVAGEGKSALASTCEWRRPYRPCSLDVCRARKLRSFDRHSDERSGKEREREREREREKEKKREKRKARGENFDSVKSTSRATDVLPSIEQGPPGDSICTHLR